MKSMMPGTTASQSCDSITSTTWLLASGWYFTRISPTTPTRTLRSTSFSGSASKVSTIFATSFAYGQYARPYNIFAVFDMPWLSSVSRTITFHRSYRRFAEPGFTSYGRTRYRHFMSHDLRHELRIRPVCAAVQHLRGLRHAVVEQCLAHDHVPPLVQAVRGPRIHLVRAHTVQALHEKVADDKRLCRTVQQRHCGREAGIVHKTLRGDREHGDLRVATGICG